MAWEVPITTTDRQEVFAKKLASSAKLYIQRVHSVEEQNKDLRKQLAEARAAADKPKPKRKRESGARVLSMKEALKAREQQKNEEYKKARVQHQKRHLTREKNRQKIVKSKTSTRNRLWTKLKQEKQRVARERFVDVQKAKKNTKQRPEPSIKQEQQSQVETQEDKGGFPGMDDYLRTQEIALDLELLVPQGDPLTSGHMEEKKEWHWNRWGLLKEAQLFFPKRLRSIQADAGELIQHVGGQT